MLVQMRRVEIIVPRSAAGEALKHIHRAGVVHLETFERLEHTSPGVFVSPQRADERGTSVDDGRFRGTLEEISKLHALLGEVPVGRDRLEATWSLDDDALIAAAQAMRPVQETADRITGDRVRAVADLERIDSYRHIIGGIAGAVGHLPRLRGYGATGIVVSTRHGALLGFLAEELEAMTDGRCEVISADLADQRTAAVLLYPAAMAGAISDLLAGRDLEEVNLPADLQGVPFEDLDSRMATEAERLRQHIAGLERAFEGLVDEHQESVSALRLVLGDRVAEHRELRRATHSDHLVVFAGWVPADEVGDLRARLAEGLGDHIIVIDHGAAPTPGQEPPVAVTNGPLVRSFEPLSRFAAVPRYGTIDPTPLMALTFPAFVGFMVADAGYGAVLLVLLMAMHGRMQRSPLLRTVWPIGLTMAMSMIFFGVLFGEAFGETIRHVLHVEPILFDRAEPGSAIIIMLAIAIAIGFAQVGLGLALGVWNSARVDHRREAVGRGALLVGLATVVLMIGAAAELLPSEVIAIAVAALIAAVVIAGLSMGIAGPVEMIGVMGNVLSYARLMAVAFAGVMLALVADRLGSLMPSIIFGVLVAVALHSLNLVLGVFDASVQGLRLHLVEFFTKFVEPGGTAYAPFTSVLGVSPSTQPEGR